MEKDVVSPIYLNTNSRVSREWEPYSSPSDFIFVIVIKFLIKDFEKRDVKFGSDPAMHHFL